MNDDQTLANPRAGRRLADGWPISNRPAVQTEAVVVPGQTATFTFSVKGVCLGSYPLRLRPVIAGPT